MVRWPGWIHCQGLINKTMHSSRKFFALPAHTKERFQDVSRHHCDIQIFTIWFVEFWECQEQYKEPSGYPPRSYGAITSPEGKIYKTQQRDDSGPGKSPAWHHRCVPSFRPIRFILWEFPGNILNEWLLVKNTSVAIDWNEPYYTSDEGLCCSCLCFVFCWNHVNPCYINILFVHLMLEHMCFLLATLAACKGLLRCVPALQMNFMRVNMKFAVNMLIDFVCYILFNTAGREFYSSVSKHPEQSQWPSEALGWLTF